VKYVKTGTILLQRIEEIILSELFIKNSAQNAENIQNINKPGKKFAGL